MIFCYYADYQGSSNIYPLSSCIYMLLLHSMSFFSSVIFLITIVISSINVVIITKYMLQTRIGPLSNHLITCPPYATYNVKDFLDNAFIMVLNDFPQPTLQPNVRSVLEI